ncbi:MAG: serine/threonine protein kinase [Planctomycetales bacterium]|nr:serine/threonine protein kinase [Planctomycetales bacterium]
MAVNENLLWAQIDAKCDAFESARKRGDGALLADYLVDDWPSDHRRILLRELLDLELEYQTRNNKPIDTSHYVSQFPQFSEVIGDCIQRHQTRLSKVTPHAAPNTTPHPVRLPTEAGDSLTLGPYELIQEIARGGMGVVYRARDHRLDRDVALKVVLAGEFASDEAIERFQFEASAAAQLDHPHIVPIFDVGQEAGRHYFAMGLVEGQDLAKAVSENLYDPRDAAKLIIKLASALQYAHDRGILHRDLKPANVLLDERQEPRLTDFGLAKSLKLESDSELTKTGQLLGTPTYMAPEQANGKLDEVGIATDVYSLGAILYYVLTGRPPFRAASVAETLRQVIGEEPVSPRVINPKSTAILRPSA